MFIVHTRDLDPVEDIGLFLGRVLGVIYRTVPYFEGTLIKKLDGGVNLPTFDRVVMNSAFFVERWRVETTYPLGCMNLVDGPCIKKHFGNLVQLFETDKDPSFGQ